MRICPSCRREFVFQREGIPVFEEVTEPPPIPPDRADDDAEPEQPQAAGASRPFWKDPIIVIGAAVPSVILATAATYIREAKAIEVEAEMAVIIPERQPVDTKYNAATLETARPAEMDLGRD